MRKILKNNLPIIFLGLIAAIVCFQNYTPGTILSGWDTLHPEFNSGLNLKREIFGVFRSYQGLGSVAAHSDMADLPRILTLAAFGIFLPVEFLRYSYIFLTLILGPIGMYLFLYKHILKDKTSSFLGALFYLLNLGTLQLFAVPFEMFVTQYATLPWLFLFATSYIFDNKHQKRTLFLFALATILSTPMAYAATLWYIYFIAFVMYTSLLIFIKNERVARVERLPTARSSFELARLERALAGGKPATGPAKVSKWTLAKKSFTLILLTLLLNSFWILPNIYYVLNHGSQVPMANINKLFSEQAFLYNKEFGNINDIAMLKSFLFDWNVYAGNNHFVQLLTPWIQHLKLPLVQLLGYLFAAISLVGIIYGIFNPFDKLRVDAERSRSIKRKLILIALLPLLFLSLFFIFNDNPPTSPLFSFLRDHLSFFKEAYRFPQDKVRGLYVFVFAIYFGAGQFAITNLLRLISSRLTMKQFNNETIDNSSRSTRTITKAQLTQLIIVALAIVYFMLPAFKGELISPYMRIKIPDYYFEMFDWFDKQPEDGKIANLPIHSFWGWDYYKWGFQGAGFIWFGIRQPVLARDFDRWTPYNEQYFREMSYAIYSQDPHALRATLEKYNIKYILLDKNIIAPPNPSKSLLFEETQQLLDGVDYIQKTKEFGKSLVVYEVKKVTPDKHYIISNPFAVSEKSAVFYEDFIYKEYGDYITQPNGVYYPFRNLTDNQNKILPNILKLTQEGVVINLPKNTKLAFPSYSDTQESIPSDLLVEKNQNLLTVTFYPKLPTAGGAAWYPSEGGAAWYPPITLKSPIPETENIILSVNKKNNYIISTSLSDAPLSLGLVFLELNKDNTVALYPSAPSQEIIPDLSAANYYLESCQDIVGKKTFGQELVNKNSFYIFGKDVPLCMTIPLSEVLPEDLKNEEAMLTVKFDYSSDLPLKFCLAKIKNSACQTYENNIGISNNDVKNLALQFRLDTTQREAPTGASQGKNIEKALYENLSLSLTAPFFSTTISNPPIPSNPFGPSSLIVPFSGNEQLSARLTDSPITSGLCPNQPSDNPSIAIKKIKEDYISYTSKEGSACDHFSYQNLSQNQAYLVAITSRNINGLPLTVCIANQITKHCDIYSSLSASSDFYTDIFLLPTGANGENGYDINIRNHGIKKTPAVNDLKSIQIIPFPYKWLSQIATMKQSNNETMNDVLVLPQSFEKGWRAYEVKSNKSEVRSWVNRNFPFLFGEELKDHVLVNNWSNGWILNNETIEQSNNGTIVFLFLPQYLEYIGILLLLETITWLIFAYHPKPTQN